MPRKSLEAEELRVQRADLRSFILDALEKYTEPDDTTGPDWHSPLWQVVRACKAHPLLQNLDGYNSWRVVRNVVSLDAFLSADSRLGNEEDVAAAWANAWDKIRYLPGETLLDACLREAEKNPVVPPRARTQGYVRFLALCAELARVGDGEISIGVERWAALFGVRPNTISSWRQWGIDDGILQLTCPHCHAARRATEFRVLLDRLPPARGTI